MPTNRVPIRRRRRDELAGDQELALWLGCGRAEFPFEDEQEAREAWRFHRERLMFLYGRSGRRPAAWWWFESPDEVEYDPDRERSILFEAGLLDPDERERLIAEWRAEFERCRAPGFSLSVGPGVPWLIGLAARRAHITEADIPASLVKKWTAGRRKEPQPTP